MNNHENQQMITCDSDCLEKVWWCGLVWVEMFLNIIFFFFLNSRTIPTTKTTIKRWESQAKCKSVICGPTQTTVFFFLFISFCFILFIFFFLFFSFLFFSFLFFSVTLSSLPFLRYCHSFDGIFCDGSWRWRVCDGQARSCSLNWSSSFLISIFIFFFFFEK